MAPEQTTSVPSAAGRGMRISASSGKAGAGCCGSGRAVAEPPATVTLTIDGRAVTVARGTTVWHAAQQAGGGIPIFCSLDRLRPRRRPVRRTEARLPQAGLVGIGAGAGPRALHSLLALRALRRDRRRR